MTPIPHITTTLPDNFYYNGLYYFEIDLVVLIGHNLFSSVFVSGSPLFKNGLCESTRISHKNIIKDT